MAENKTMEMCMHNNFLGSSFPNQAHWTSLHVSDAKSSRVRCVYFSQSEISYLGYALLYTSDTHTQEGGTFISFVEM